MKYRLEITDTELILWHDQGPTRTSIPLATLAKALRNLPSTSCPACGGRGVEDAHETGDGNGGPCTACDGSGVEPSPRWKGH